MSKANNPELRSWIEVDPESDFPIQNLPFGIFVAEGRAPRAGVALGDWVIDLSEIHDAGLFSGLGLPDQIFVNNSLNAFIGLGKAVTGSVRDRLSDLFSEDAKEIQSVNGLEGRCLVAQSDVEMLLPVDIGDYTDFYSSEQHAFNVGSMFRDPNNALLPNWKHIPVGYHGRASSIIPSGTPIRRPKGQTKEDNHDAPVFGPTKRLDFELEMAFITGKATSLGETVTVDQAGDYIFGFALFNDWSARDVQKWEYVPLGPFLAKNFASSLSPWIVTLEALEPYRTEGSVQIPEVLPYLKSQGARNFDINLEVIIETPDGTENLISESNFKHMYWDVNQQLAHQTVNGCNINVGDLYASGTISGPTPESYGSMLELAWKGTKPLKMKDGTERKFIQDHDTVIMRGYGKANGIRVGFGEVRTKVLPAYE